MANPASWYSQGEPDTQSVTCFVDPSTGAQYVVHTAQPLPVSLGVPAATSLSAVSAIGAGTALNGYTPHSSHTMVITTSAGVSAGAVALQGSLDNVNWFQIIAPVTTNAASTVFAASVGASPYQYVRAAVTTTITGGTVTVLVASA